MALVRQAGFHGGEVEPGLAARPDFDGRKVGARTLRNFIPLPTGPAQNRPGFMFVGATKDSGARKARLVPFTFSTSQSYLLEFGHLYIRIWQGGGRVLDGDGDPIQITTSYTEAQLPDLTWTQSGDTLTIFLLGVATGELVRNSQTTWTLSTYSTTNPLTAPSGLAFASPLPTETADPTHAVKPWDWVVTVIKDGVESPPATKVSKTCQLAPDRPVYLSCTTYSGASEYCWYRGRYGKYGYVGNSTSGLFMDEGQAPNYSDAPPTGRTPFASNEWPAVGCYFQQRLVVANQPSEPQRVLASKTGAFHNWDYSLPQKDDDALDFVVSSRQYEEIRALVPLAHLLVLTANSEFAVDNGDAPISPSAFNLKRVSSNGSSWLQPLVVNDVVLYVPPSYSRVRELLFDTQRGFSGSWSGGDVSLAASHLLHGAGRTVVAWAYQRSPDPVVWMVRDDGALLSLTYSKDMKVAAWARHDTDGVFESVCSIPEGDEDALYVIVKRHLPGNTLAGDDVRYIERLASRRVLDRRLGCFLDSSVYYGDAPRTNLPALGHLAGKAVTVLADGEVITGLTVSGDGSVTLTEAATDVFVGLPYESDIELLDVVAEQAEVRADQKLVSRVVWEVDRSAGVWAGETLLDLQPWRSELGHVTDATGLTGEQLVVPILSSWNRGGRAVLRQSDPLPVTVLSAARDVEVGGV